MPPTFRSLRSLTIDSSGKGYAHVTDAGMRHVGRLRSLRTLSMQKYGYLSDEAVADVLAELPILTSLNVSGCEQVGDRTLTAIGTAANRSRRLEALDVAHCHISDDGLRALCAAPLSRSSLKHLNLAGCHKLTVSGLRCLIHLSRLQSLDLTGVANACDCDDLENLTPELISLNITALRRLPFCRVASLRHLLELRAIGAASDEDLVALQNMSLLRVLVLSWGVITHVGITSACRQSPLLTSLTLCGTSVCNASILCIVEHLLHLEQLDLSYCAQISDEGLVHLAKMKHLRSLDLHACTSVRAREAACLHRIGSLTSLSLAGVEGGVDGTLGYLDGHMTLRHLNVAGFLPFTNGDATSVSRVMQLVELNMSMCWLVDDAVVNALMDGLRVVECLDIRGTSISPSGMEMLKQGLPLCAVVYL
jgi:F-box and leucine-rich repeat protein 14